MKVVLILSLFFSVLCNSQQNSNDHKYLELETISKKSRELKDQYDSLVEKNKRNLINEDGVYFNKALYEQEKQKKNGEWINPLLSKSTYTLKAGDNEFFIKDEGQGLQIYLTKKGYLMEQIHMIKKDGNVERVINFSEGISASYDDYNHKISVYHFIQDQYDPHKEDLMLYREYINKQVVSEKNYKKDFKISKEQMLKELPSNFYYTALDYLVRKQEEWHKKREIEKSVNEIETEIKKRLQPVKNRLQTALETKNDFYKEIRIFKLYNESNTPFYHLTIPENPAITSVYWMINIDGKSNKITRIEQIIPID
ncbi:hypothetical protein [Chryseobacterium sp.]|uniref:hypothetical protein n=1 Tax=Chryseobacterium sp. TaxID=1871047 RepID=UPI0025C55519|nr:hypothetical protein [Chryseobacterium sp.]MBV8327005.1 hypothetical protein [Chryseobacterium sp.]